MINQTLDTRTQLRGVCPACFSQQATRGGNLVDHGYRRPQQWHANVGTCNGAGRPHFGTIEGRDYAGGLATTLRLQATDMDRRADDVAAGVGRVYARKRVAVGVSQEVEIENPTADQRVRYASQLRGIAQQMRMGAVDFDKAVAAWVPAELKTVTVAVATGPLVHFYSAHYRGKMCASSMMGAMKGFTSKVLSDVTCEKCKARVAKKGTK